MKKGEICKLLNCKKKGWCKSTCNKTATFETSREVDNAMVAQVRWLCQSTMLC